MENVDAAVNDSSNELEEFIKNRSLHPMEDEFRDYIQNLLATFMPENYLQIFMSDKPLPVVADISSEFRKSASHLYGPFSIIRHAFTDEKISEINLTTLEFYGDKRLGMVVQIFLMVNFPNIRSSEQLTNMLKYYVSNTTLANFADQLGMPAWLVRDQYAGVLLKERANVFESFIGALLLIGEIYIGFMVGETITRVFLDKFLSLQLWTLDASFYVTPSTLLNDWLLALPQKDKPKESKQHQQLSDGTHSYTYKLEGEIIRKMCGRSKVIGRGNHAQKTDAKEIAIAEISQEIGLTRNTIDEVRSIKRSNPNWKAQEARIYAKFPKLKDSMPTFRFPNAKRRGGGGKIGKFFFYIEEWITENIGKNKTGFYEAVARGIGDTELDAFKNAVDNLLNGNRLTPVYGTDLYLADPDSSPLLIVDSATASLRKPYTKQPSEQLPHKREFVKQDYPKKQYQDRRNTNPSQTQQEPLEQEIIQPTKPGQNPYKSQQRPPSNQSFSKQRQPLSDIKKRSGPL